MLPRFHILAVLLLIFLSQCTKDTPPPVEPAAPAIPLDSHPLTIAINHTTKTTIQAKVPPGFVRSEFKGNVFLSPETDKPAFMRSSIEYNANCSGLCDASKMTENIKKHFHELRNRTYRTDTFVTPTVTTLGEGSILENGLWLAARIDYPDGTKQDGSTLEGLRAWGLHYVPEQPYFIVTYASAPLDTHSDAWDVLMHAVQQSPLSP
ncbi:MAG: hypothetical protein CMH54_06540 [Myxococcales bacterium]|nr:hypothetical protein [Myxococcales bacterium]